MDFERGVVLAGAFVLTLAVTAIGGPAMAHPPSEPGHGTNETRFPLLWSGDHDGNVSTDGETSNGVAIRQLANGTDLPLNAPPQDVERWNAGDIEEFPDTNRSVSIRPAHADTGGGRFVKDAHATLFAIQPSTRTRLSPSEQPLYVGSDGEVLGTVDYRVRIPEDDTTGDRQVYWSLEEHRIDETRLVIDGETVASNSGSHTPQFDFADLDPGSHRIAVEADVFVKLEKHVRTEETECEYRENTTRCWTDVDHDYSYPTETITVQDDRAVVGYELSVSGKRASFPDGSTGLALSADQPWLGYSLPNGNVSGVWRFYSARVPSWDTLVYESANDSTRRHSPLHPLQVNAFPLEMGASASQPTARVVATDGERRNTPMEAFDVSTYLAVRGEDRDDADAGDVITTARRAPANLTPVAPRWSQLDALTAASPIATDEFDETLDATTPMLGGAVGAMFPFVSGAFAEPGIEYGTYALTHNSNTSSINSGPPARRTVT